MSLVSIAIFPLLLGLVALYIGAVWGQTQLVKHPLPWMGLVLPGAALLLCLVLGIAMVPLAVVLLAQFLVARYRMGRKNSQAAEENRMKIDDL